MYGMDFKRNSKYISNYLNINIGIGTCIELLVVYIYKQIFHIILNADNDNSKIIKKKMVMKNKSIVKKKYNLLM